MERQKVIDRIKKLKALAKNNPNKNEGLSASNKVEELLKKYNLTMADVDGIINPIKVKYEYKKYTDGYTDGYTDDDNHLWVKETKTPFFETWIGMLFLLAIKGLFGTPVGWAVCYMIVSSLIK